MNSRFYLSFDVDWDFLLLRYIDENGQRKQERVKLRPALYIPSALEDEKYQTYDGKPVSRVQFNSVREARNFVSSYENTPNFKIYGSPLYHYVHMYEHFKNQTPDLSRINILNFDIETDTEGGYPNIQLADKEINAITVKKFKDKNVFMLGFVDYSPQDPELLNLVDQGYKIHYRKCKDEAELLRSFIKIWQKIDPDVVTGWNITMFDIQYIIKRIRYILGDDAANELSPFGKIRHRVVNVFNKENDVYEIVGVQRLDYMEIYKKFSSSVEESYSLNYLSQKILNKTKLDYSEYGTLAKLYSQNPVKYMDYNAIDVIRVEQIDEAVNFMDIAFEIAYETHSNYTDSFTTIRNWDTMTHNYLIDRNIVVPHSTDNRKERSIAGGYVKQPIIGKHRWVMSFDFKSLYPHLSMVFNISPDTYLGTLKDIFGERSVDKILEGRLDAHRDAIYNNNVTVTGAGTVFSRKKKGFIPAIMERLFEKRVTHQTQEDHFEKLAAKGDADAERQVTIFGNKSYAIKILLNSGYGALSNEFYRFFHDNIAESFTLSGQLSIRFVSDRVNQKMNQLLNTTDIDYIVAIDTDSQYISMDGYVDRFCGDTNVVDALEKFSDEVQGWIQSALEELYSKTNAFQKKLFMALEAIGPGIWMAKKRYIMSLPSFKKIRYDPPRIKIQGIEAVRSTTPLVARDWIKDGIPLVINGTEDEVKSFVDAKWQEFTTLAFDDIAMPKGTNDLEKYANEKTIYEKGTPLHVRGALLYNDYLKKRGWEIDIDTIKTGDRVKVMYLTLPNPLMENVISTPEEIPEEFTGFVQYIDYSKQFDKVFFDAFKRITDAAGMSLTTNISMDDFYG